MTAKKKTALKYQAPPHSPSIQATSFAHGKVAGDYAGSLNIRRVTTAR